MAKRGRPRKHDLPKRAPKRTGKRGPRPVDPEPEHQLVETGQLSLIEDAALDDLENLAKSYASVRDRRMALTLQEVDANALVLKKMKEYGKTTYRRDGIEINVVTSEEKAKVKIKDED